MAVVDEIPENTPLHWADYVVILIYFIFVIGVGIWTSTRNRGSVKGYFLAGQNQHWIPVGASIFASNIGSQHFLGLAGGGAANGFSVAYYELHAVIIVLLLGWVFVPVYLASGTNTMPEYLRLRFGGRRIRVFMSGLSLIAYVFMKISIDLYAGTVFVEQATRLNMYGSIAAIVGAAALFTITGGLTAVIWTDFVQTIIMVIGAVLLCILSFIKVGGYERLVYEFHGGVPGSLLTTNSSCGMPAEESFHIFRDPLSDDLPWPGALTGAILKSLWYWCADQVIVQRALAAKNFTHAKAGTCLAAVLKMLPLFLLVMPGMIARILYPTTVGCADAETCMKVCGSTVGCSNIAYSTLVLNLMPTGLRGVMLAVMLAALMSSLTSVFNSSSTLFTLDIWSVFRKNASSREMMIVGRVFVLVQVCVSVFWVPLLRGSHGSQIFTYTVQVGSFFQPPVIALFTLALFTSRINEKGAFWSLIVGSVIGISRFAIEYSYEKPTCGQGEDTRPGFVKDLHFLYFAVILYVLCVLVAVIISLLTKPIDPKHLHRLTFWSRFDRQPRVNLGAADDEGREIQETEQQPEESKTEFTSPPPWYKKAALWVCGIDHTVENDAKVIPARESTQIPDHESLQEKSTLKTLTNCIALSVGALSIFVMVFYK